PYGVPRTLAKAIDADLSVEVAEATLYADDGAAEHISEFQSGKLTLGVNDIGRVSACELTGASVDDNGVLISGSEDAAEPVAVGFRALRSKGTFRYFWLYRVLFKVPSTSLETKGDNISFKTPSIEGAVYRRNRLDARGRHPWKAEVTEGDANVSPSTIARWYSAVYEPNYGGAGITIDTQPVGISVTAGAVSGTLTVIASTSAGNLTYQWYRNTSNSTSGGTLVSGATGASYSLPSSLTAGTSYYYCIVSNGTTSVVTVPAAVVVTSAGSPATLAFTTQPADKSVTAGSITGVLTAAASATDDSALSYQWYRNTANSTSGGTAISGATAGTLTIPTDLTAGTYYFYCKATSASLGTVYSNIAVVTVAAAGEVTGTITITAQPGSISTTAGSVSGTLTVLATSSDDSTLSYQWFEATTDSNASGTPISDATNRAYSVPVSLQEGLYYYYCVIGSPTCASVKTNAITVTVEAGTATIRITAQPDGKTVSAGAISGELSVTASATDGSTLTYQWYQNTTDSNSGGTLVPGATSASLAIPTDLAQGNYYYYCVVSASGLTSVLSDTALVTVLAEGSAQITITASPNEQTFDQYTDNAGISIVASASDGGTLSYQWYSNSTASNSDGTLISGATGATYSVPTSTAGTFYYYCVISAANADSVTSNVCTVTVDPVEAAISITTQPADVTVTEGVISGSLTIAAKTNNGADVTFQWYSNTGDSASGGTALTGETGASLTIPTDLVEGAHYYYCVVSASGLTAVTSNVATVTVTAEGEAVITLTATPGTQSFANGTTNAAISVVAASSDNSALSYQWYSNTTDSNSGGTLIPGATDRTYTVPTDTNGTFYYYCVVGSATCASVTSSVGTVTIEE
ncbi:MAG: hypothetical protein PHG12_10360, partial [Sphaerochaeta sp.]|nr:hypothetical protein [Sphaerochaeta sp.]